MTAPNTRLVDQRRPLGRSSVTVSRIGFGTAPLGGLYSELTDADAAAACAAAWDAGIRYFDTAPHYGAGLAERRLGSFLAGRPRAEATVSTKVGRLLVPGQSAPGDFAFYGDQSLVRVRDYTEQGVYRSLADSLERSGLDRFDVVLIHDPDDYWAPASERAFPALARLRAEGAIGAIGVGMNQTAMLSKFVRVTDVDCVMVAGRYSLLDRSAEDELLPLCARRQVGVIVAGVFNSGILADPSPGAHYDYAPAAPSVLARAQAMAARCASFGVPLAAAALRFPLRHPAVTGIVLGLRSVAEVEAAQRHTDVDIPAELWTELENRSATDA